MTTQIVSAVSGSNAYYILRKKSDQTVWNGSAFAPWSNGSITSYDLAGAGVFDDKGGDIWLATLPSAAVTAAGNSTLLLIPYYYQVNGTPALDDTKLPNYEINLSGAATASPGGTFITIGNAVDILQRTSRSAAGYANANSGRYELEDFHTALQVAMSDFVDQTRCTCQFDTIAIADDDTSVDLSSISGFSREKLTALRIDDERAIRIGSMAEVIDQRRTNPAAGSPTLVAFSSFTTLQFWETVDDDYTLNIDWRPDLVSWTAGDSGVADTLINIPANLARQVAATGAVCVLQFGLIDMAPLNDRARIAYDALVKRSLGAGNDGSSVAISIPAFRTPTRGQ